MQRHVLMVKEILHCGYRRGTSCLDIFISGPALGLGVGARVGTALMLGVGDGMGLLSDLLWDLPKEQGLEH